MPALVIALVTLAGNARAYDPITWRAVAGGGVAFASAGGYRLGATIGQSDAGTLASGPFALRGGFWTGGVLATLGVDDAPAPAGPFRFYPARPNPMRSATRIAFDLPRASRAALSVFDLSGRLVQRADYGRLPAGRQERAWSAVDRDGRALPSGVYFLRLETERDQGVHRVLVLR